MMTWEPYDPTWLMDLARQQKPEKTWLVEALSRCTQCYKATPWDVFFVSPDNPNTVGAEWQFRTNIRLESPEYGTLILDVLTEQRIGGVEFVTLLGHEYTGN